MTQVSVVNSYDTAPYQSLDRETRSQFYLHAYPVTVKKTNYNHDDHIIAESFYLFLFIFLLFCCRLTQWKVSSFLQEVRAETEMQRARLDPSEVNGCPDMAPSLKKSKRK